MTATLEPGCGMPTIEGSIPYQVVIFVDLIIVIIIIIIIIIIAFKGAI